jgi:hypothetical protein
MQESDFSHDGIVKLVPRGGGGGLLVKALESLRLEHRSYNRLNMTLSRKSDLMAQILF